MNSNILIVVTQNSKYFSQPIYVYRKAIYQIGGIQDIFWEISTYHSTNIVDLESKVPSTYKLKDYRTLPMTISTKKSPKFEYIIVMKGKGGQEIFTFSIDLR